MPLLAIFWVAAAAVSHQIWAAFSPVGLNAGPLVVVCIGMILAAFIDGWALKVPNWVTLPLVLSGWMLGLLHQFEDQLGFKVDAGTGTFVDSFLCTLLGFVLLFPMLAIRGVGEGDVKMQMGFAAWMGAYFGTGDTTAAVGGLGRLHAGGAVFWAFAFGAVIGGAFALIMIFIRRDWSANARMVKEIGGDLKMIGAGNIGEATKRAQERRQVWVKLPYGIPLCVGFLLFLGYRLVLIVP
jgi:prepilin peptidase CpaA